MSTKPAAYLSGSVLSRILLGCWLMLCGLTPAAAHTAEASATTANWQQMKVAPTAVTAFQLRDQHGRPFTPVQLQGHWHWLLFGFTHCPDICPVHLAQLAQMRKQLQQQGVPAADLPQVVMISIDPQRDTPELMGKFVQQFDQSFLGVSGDKREIDRLEAELGAAHRLFSADSTGNYRVMHGTSIYAIDPKGSLVAAMVPPFSPAKLVSYFHAMSSEQQPSLAKTEAAAQLANSASQPGATP